MANTPIYGFRYPTLTQPPNVPLDLQNLATDVENTVAGIDNRVASANPEARYARTSGTQSLSSSADNQLQFPAVIRSNAAVTPSGPNNNAFKVTPGKWLCIASLRLSAGVAASGELSIAFGPAAAWQVGNIVAVDGSGTANYNVSGIGFVPSSGDYYFTASFWQSSGSAVNAVVFGQATSIDLVRIG